MWTWWRYWDSLPCLCFYSNKAATDSEDSECDCPIRTYFICYNGGHIPLHTLEEHTPHCKSAYWIKSCHITMSQCRRQGGQQEQFAPGPQCKGAPKQCRTCSNKIRLSVTFQSSFFKGLVSLYFRLKSALLFCFAFQYAADANNARLSYVATAQSAN